MLLGSIKVRSTFAPNSANLSALITYDLHHSTFDPGANLFKIKVGMHAEVGAQLLHLDAVTKQQIYTGQYTRGRARAGARGGA